MKGGSGGQDRGTFNSCAGLKFAHPVLRPKDSPARGFNRFASACKHIAYGFIYGLTRDSPDRAYTGYTP